MGAREILNCHLMSLYNQHVVRWRSIARGETSHCRRKHPCNKELVSQMLLVRPQPEYPTVPKHLFSVQEKHNQLFPERERQRQKEGSQHSMLCLFGPFRWVVWQMGAQFSSSISYKAIFVLYLPYPVPWLDWKIAPILLDAPRLHTNNTSPESQNTRSLLLLIALG